MIASVSACQQETRSLSATSSLGGLGVSEIIPTKFVKALRSLKIGWVFLTIVDRWMFNRPWRHRNLPGSVTSLLLRRLYVPLPEVSLDQLVWYLSRHLPKAA